MTCCLHSTTVFNYVALTGSESEDDEDIDLFEDVGSESDGDLGGQESTRDLHYEEFFDPPDEEVETEAFSKSRKKKAKVTFSNMEEDSGSEEEGVGGGTDESAEEEERGSGSEEEFSGSGQEIEPSMEEGGKEDLSMYQRKKILVSVIIMKIILGVNSCLLRMLKDMLSSLHKLIA